MGPLWGMGSVDKISEASLASRMKLLLEMAGMFRAWRIERIRRRGVSESSDIL